MVADVEVFNGDGGWQWRLRAYNGEILAHSEVYPSQVEAERTASMVATQLSEGGSDVNYQLLDQ